MNEMKDSSIPMKEASPESIARLRDNFKAHITGIGQILENIIPVYKTCLDLLKNPLLADNCYLLELKITYEVAITFYMAELENATLFRADFSNRTNYLYRRTLLLQFYRVSSEATKALFGFGKNSRHALWNRLISSVDLSTYSSELNEINVGVDKLKSEVINKDARDFACHYNWDTLTTAKFFTSIDDEDIICKDWNQYLYVAERISFILSKLFSILATARVSGTNSIHSEIIGRSSPVSSTQIRWYFDQMLLKPRLVHEIHSTYNITEKQLNQSISLCSQFKALNDFAEKYAPNLKGNFSLQTYQKILNAAGVLAFMTNDAHAAAIALTESTSFWESRMHLKRLDVSIYEALDKIVGFTDKAKKKSLFQTINAIIDDLPAMVKERSAVLKEETEPLIKKYGLSRSERRCSFVHYRSGKDLWLINAYDNLLSINVPESLVKFIEVRNLTTDIIRFVTLFAEALSDREKLKSNQRIHDLFQQFSNLISMIKDENTRNTTLQTLNSIQNNLIK